MASIRTILSVSAFGLSLAAAPAFAQQPTVEVLHYWTSGGESKAVAELKAGAEAAGRSRGFVWPPRSKCAR